MIKNSKLCPLCGGYKKTGTTTYSIDIETSIIVVRNVKAKICTQCGEEWIDNKTADGLEKIVEDVRKKKSQIEVIAM